MHKSTSKNPWLTIWTKPRKAIRSVVETNPNSGFYLISIILGLVVDSLFLLINWYGILALFAMMILISIIGWLLQVTGRWIGGHGSFQNTRAAFVWALFPVVAWMGVMIFINWVGLFSVEDDSVYRIFIYGYALGPVACLWTIVLQCFTLAEVHRFSAWKGLFNFLITAIIIGVVSVAICMIVS
jgi:hypothetical protein